MADRESLSDKAVDMCAKINVVEQMLKSVNDYGDPTDFCSEFDQIVNDAHSQMGAIRARLYTLRRRFERNNPEKP